MLVALPQSLLGLHSKTNNHILPIRCRVDSERRLQSVADLNP
jgi:hypothetical protein